MIAQAVKLTELKVHCTTLRSVNLPLRNENWSALCWDERNFLLDRPVYSDLEILDRMEAGRLRAGLIMPDALTDPQTPGCREKLTGPPCEDH